MANRQYTQKTSFEPLELNGPASLAIDIGSFLYWDGTSLVKPVTSQTTQATEAADQQLFALNFAGVSRSARLAADAAAGAVRFDTVLVAKVPCVSNTFKPGDYLGITWDGGAAAVDQKLAKVTHPARAIAMCVELQASAVTEIWVVFISRKFSPFGSLFGFGQGHLDTVGASTAAAGSAVGDAAALPAGTGTTYPVTAADDTKGVIMHAADDWVGNEIFVANLVSNKILKIYPPTGGTINGAAANAAYSTASGKGALLRCVAALTWAAIG